MEKLLTPYNYLVNTPGKAIRSKLLLAFNYWFHVPTSTLNDIISIVEMLHSASLLIDDIEDNSLLRRGQPVAHRIFGIPCTLNTANYVYFLALKKVLDLGHANAPSVFTDELLSAHVGQGLEIYWRDNSICPSELEYLDMVSKKTSALMRLGVRLLIDQAPEPIPNPNLYLDLCKAMGEYFQIRDDYLNLTSTDLRKGFCDDIQEGKFSFPRTSELDLIEHALHLIQNTHSLAYTLTALTDRELKIHQQVLDLGNNPALMEILNYLKV